jgi:hypothetical protein
MTVDHTVPETSECCRLENTLHGLSKTRLFPIVVYGFSFSQMGRDLRYVTRPLSDWTCILSSIEAEILSLAPRPVDPVCAFLPIDISILLQPQTIAITPFGGTFVGTIWQNPKPEVLARVLTRECFLTSSAVIISENRVFVQGWRCRRLPRPSPYGVSFRGNFSSILYQFSVHSTNWVHWICELAMFSWQIFFIHTWALEAGRISV